MTTSLSYASTTLALPSDMLWADEYAWQAVTQRTEYSITGALLIESAPRQAGRPITLQGGANYAWMQRATLDQLRAWASIPGAELLLVLRGETARTVMFDNDRGALEALPVVDFSQPTGTDFYQVTLRFIET